MYVFLTFSGCAFESDNAQPSPTENTKQLIDNLNKITEIKNSIEQILTAKSKALIEIEDKSNKLFVADRLKVPSNKTQAINLSAEFIKLALASVFIRI